MIPLKRLYIFTGKGGVGKTTCAFSFCEYLKKEGKEVLYAYIAGTSIQNGKIENTEIKSSVKTLPLELKKSTAEYVEMKLKSKIVANLVVKAPFFKSLVSMIPGFNYLIYLGKVIHTLNKNPKLHIVFDSPSSGHALTMLRATQNFSEIFNSGVVYEDTKMMKNFLFENNLIKVNIISLPTEMAKNEGIELQDEINTIDKGIETQVIYNNVLPNDLKKSNTLPQFLKKKIENQQEVLKDLVDVQIPHGHYTEKEDIVREIIPFMEKLI